MVEEPGFIAHELTAEARPSEPITIEKVVTLFTSRDRSVSDAWTEAISWSGRLGGFIELLRPHVLDWDDLWKRFSLELECHDGRTRLALHLHIFHLLQTTSRNTLDLDVGVPARGLHGEAYRGHVFWDELFIYPYLNLHLPELVRSLLLYRYRRLPEARWAARQSGFRGAMYPWQSGSNGREEAQVVHLNPLSGRWLPDASHLQRHIGSAIAYNVWKYYQATGDIDFMVNFGAEMIFEISRFWASIAEYDPALDRYEIVGVMGPDEYHDGYVGASAPGLRNNKLHQCDGRVGPGPSPRTGRAPARTAPQRVASALSLDDAELAHWEDVSRKMHLIFHRDGVISQFEGYEDLAELDWDAYRDRYGDISRLDRILEGENDTPNAYKASKQADVLMLFYLLSSQELRRSSIGSAMPLTPTSFRAPSTTTCNEPRTGRPSAEWCTAGYWPAPTASVRGSSSRTLSAATWMTSRVGPPPKGSIWAPWPARWTFCSAATWASKSGMTGSGSIPFSQQRSRALLSTSATAGGG